MKKIVAVIGSPNNEKSNTIAMTKDFLDAVISCSSDTEYEIISLGDKNLGMCRGCWACTKAGCCVLQDDLQEIQKKILDSDLFILGSPVYVHNVSAQTKVLLDRLFIWLHTVRLMGKPALTAVTTAGSGMKETEKYLDSMLAVLGNIVVGHLRGIAYQPGEFPKRELLREKHRSLAQKTARILEGDIKIRPTFKNSYFFWGMKYKVKFSQGKLSYEDKYWREKGWMDMSFKKAMLAEQKAVKGQ